MMRRRHLLLAALLLAAAAATATLVVYVYHAPRDLAAVLRLYGGPARARLAPTFARAHVSYPPRRVALLAFKAERRLALWAGDGKSWHFIRTYPILAASGHAGPKLREGDYQVPEGLYLIEQLNPASSYHLSMKVSYPNAFDRHQAAIDLRTRLGGDIFIHGKNLSIGCIAVGDVAIEELFTLVADAGREHVRVIIAPNDLRVASAPVREDTPLWVVTLYRSIAAALADFPAWLESDRSIDVLGMSKVQAKR
jgi:murein L,D-transpeptidase YafK